MRLNHDDGDGDCDDDGDGEGDDHDEASEADGLLWVNLHPTLDFVQTHGWPLANICLKSEVKGTAKLMPSQVFRVLISLHLYFSSLDAFKFG